jgi:hypothetical protein
VRAQFDAALRIDPACELAYRNLMYALAPRWGGTNEALLEFARRAAREHPTDARLGLLVHFAHLDVQGGLGEAEHRVYYRDPAVWSEVSDALRRLIDAHPGSRWGHNSLALMAMRAGKRDVALHEFRWIGRRWHSGVWNGDLSRFEQARYWALESARAAPASPP